MDMPTGSYDPWLGQSNLYDPVALPLDAKISRSLQAYRDGSGPMRQELRRSIDQTTGYTLLTFARRSAVFAMRQASAEILADGLAACAVLDDERVDERDILVALAMLVHAAPRTGRHADEAMRQAAELASPSIARLIEGSVGRSAVEQDLRDAWGLVEVTAPDGIGLLQWGFRPWMPTLDVTGAAVKIVAAISAGDYQADDPTLAVELPEIWLSEARDPALGAILGSARGSALVHGRLRPATSEHHESQQLSIWVVEAPDASSAAQLHAMAAHARPETATLGVSVAALFALAIGRSFVMGVPSFETTTRLARFEPGLRDALWAAAV